MYVSVLTAVDRCIGCSFPLLSATSSPWSTRAHRTGDVVRCSGGILCPTDIPVQLWGVLTAEVRGCATKEQTTTCLKRASGRCGRIVALLSSRPVNGALLSPHGQLGKSVPSAAAKANSHCCGRRSCRAGEWQSPDDDGRPRRSQAALQHRYGIWKHWVIYIQEEVDDQGELGTFLPRLAFVSHFRGSVTSGTSSASLQ
jgi:hypothetical protein